MLSGGVRRPASHFPRAPSLCVRNELGGGGRTEVENSIWGCGWGLGQHGGTRYGENLGPDTCVGGGIPRTRRRARR